MKHVFKRTLPLLLAVLLIIGCIPLVSFGENSPTLTLNTAVTIDFNTEEDSEKTLDFTPSENGFYVFYSEGSEDVYGSVCLDDFEIAYGDDFCNINFYVLCQLKKGTTYQLTAGLLGGEIADDGIVTVKIVKIDATTLNIGQSITQNIAPLSMALFQINCPEETSYILSSEYADSIFASVYLEEIYEEGAYISNDSSFYSGICLYDPAEWNYYVLAVSSNEDTPKEFTLTSTMAVPATGIKLNYASYEGVAGGTFYLEATFLPENAAQESITWVSSDESVATVDGDGCVYLMKAGTATITAQTETLSATCNITVKATPTISLCTPVAISLRRGERTAFLFTVSKEDTYCFSSFDIEGLSADPRGDLYDLNTGAVISWGDDTDGRHFRFVAHLKAGTYLLELSSFANPDSNDSDAIRSFMVQVTDSYNTIPTHFANGKYTANGESGHSGVCDYCGKFTEPHTYDDNGICKICKYEHVESDSTPGDANNDGAVDISDVTDLLKHLAGTAELSENADVDQNGDIDISDVTELLKILAGD